MLHTQHWIFSLLSPKIFSLSSPFFPLFALSSCPPPPLLARCLSQLLCPLPLSLPDRCTPALPSDRECCVVVRMCAVQGMYQCDCAMSVCVGESILVLILDAFAHVSFVLFAQKRHAEAESIRQRSRSSSVLTAQSCIPKAPLLHPYTRAQALIRNLCCHTWKENAMPI